MATENGGCCAGGGDHQHDHTHDHDDVDLTNDPTLMSCCEKDQIAYDRAMELKRVLTDHDPSTQNVRMRQQVVMQPPEAQAQSVTTSKAVQTQAALAASAIAQKLRELDIQSDSDEDLDLDADEFFAARRQELAAQFESAAKNAAAGYGIILETNFSSLTKELKASPEVPRVAFVRASGIEANAAYDMLKEMLSVANRYVGTKFYSIVTSANNSADEEAMRQLRLTSAPTVVAFRRGQRVDATAILEKDLASSTPILWEARLIPWLTMCNVLETSRQDKQPLPDGSMPMKRTLSIKRGESTEESDEVAFDCGVSGCRIRFAYEHEHVGPSQESKTEISAWRSTSTQA